MFEHFSSGRTRAFGLQLVVSTFDRFRAKRRKFKAVRASGVADPAVVIFGNCEIRKHAETLVYQDQKHSEIAHAGFPDILEGSRTRAVLQRVKR